MVGPTMKKFIDPKKFMPAFIWGLVGLSGTIQIVSGSNRRAFLTVARYVERNALRAKFVEPRVAVV
jgi:hypothetical protein